MAKKENNRKNYAAREAWEKRKREGRSKQIWREPPTLGIEQIERMTLIELTNRAAQRGWRKKAKEIK